MNNINSLFLILPLTSGAFDTAFQSGITVNKAMLIILSIKWRTYSSFSWGKQWGMDGYVKIARDKNNHCGTASFAVYPTV
jgi:hypothetical protein